MYGSLVFTNTAITSANNTISFNHHTSSVYVLNRDNTVDATIKLNGIYQIVVPHTPSQSTGHYLCIPGDYTTIQVITANVTLSVFAVG